MTTRSNPTFVANKYYQLEELEDKDDSSTEVFLKDDGTVAIGKTDGPPPVYASGEWDMKGKEFMMTLTRTYEGGHQPSRSTDAGEFKYKVKRTYQGELGHVGEEMAVIGGIIYSIHPELGDEKVGFFNIIDTTDVKSAAAP